MDARSHLDVLLDLDTRHDQLLRQLAELDARIHDVLTQYTRGKARQVAPLADNLPLKASPEASL